MMVRIVASLTLARAIAPVGRASVFGCGAPFGGSAASWEPAAALVPAFFAELGALACAPAIAAHNRLSPATIAARLHSFSALVQNRFIVVAFPFQSLSSAPAF